MTGRGTTGRIDPQAWAMSRYLIGSHGWLAVFVVVPAYVAVTVVAFMIDRYGTVDSSVWEGATQLSRWYALGIAIYVVTTHLPLHIAHGGTRREFAFQLGVLCLAFSAMLSTLVTLGFVVESVVYRMRDWPQDVSGYALFDSASQLGWIFVTFFLVFVVWTTVVSAATAAFYRNAGWGWLAVLPALAVLGVAEGVLGSDALPFVTDFLWFDEAPASVVAVTVCLAWAVAASVVTWIVVRDIAVRSRTT